MEPKRIVLVLMALSMSLVACGVGPEELETEHDKEAWERHARPPPAADVSIRSIASGSSASARTAIGHVTNFRSSRSHGLCFLR